MGIRIHDHRVPYESYDCEHVTLLSRRFLLATLGVKEGLEFCVRDPDQEFDFLPFRDLGISMLITSME